MVTVVDPGGTPIPVYSPSGITIQTVSGAGTGGFNSAGQSSAAQLVRYTDHSVYLVASGNGIRLPNDAQVGDVVEIHEWTNFAIFTVSGETISNTTVTGQTFGAGDGPPPCVILRKVSSTNWEPMTNFTVIT